MSDDSRVAVVQKVVNGKHGPYAVALSEDAERLNLTFSLQPGVWDETSKPEPGTFVILSNLSRKRGGWRALRGRFTKPSDELPALSKEQ